MVDSSTSLVNSSLFLFTFISFLRKRSQLIFSFVDCYRRQGDKLVDDNKLILTDADAKNSNRYNVVIHGDTHNAFNVSYNTLPIEGSKGVPYTAIFMSESPETVFLPLVHTSINRSVVSSTLNLNYLFLSRILSEDT